MNERQAESEGLQFTGIYKRSKEEVKQLITEERIAKKGCRIVLVTVPDNKLSRGGCGVGYSAYADEIYFAYVKLDKASSVVYSHSKAIDYIKEECAKKLAEQMERYNQAYTDMRINATLIHEKNKLKED